MRVEQSYKQVKQTLGWTEYQVRADRAIRRHWQLVVCAFSFCWWAEAALAGPVWGLSAAAAHPTHEVSGQEEPVVVPLAAPGKKSRDGLGLCEGLRSWPLALRHVRAWLEPGIMLWRYWRAWSAKVPPPALQQLLDWRWEGHVIDLSIR